ncbi:hypothetical protein AMES_7176 [Amycolatopsis mediterranei S699]|uniref:Uncharacterized protein n=2 Tax=Amycolatopsis mediterranei TaxID=33910 RepID=A0A0H3DFM0_AMYMU|nr:hypothetical protein [Amycolatopsis mediterranei]ADJ49002.1 hypothetical protein AMED_7286 [Amycolatopsis mediterranei U32]AEK45952.1 hypothetical protein RAM_37425 [Amycolatopsis mediterranei S699]AFO80710.1 hypothetical protein AMES_7176 [Amycolatopsis mediterranei S699]AGT87838.1 hypothetical protein B737_7176 [Amycolatopsis mediterranei RB]KDU93880.1 hypothetical protein DV36_00645 [Amycolatopsis mediterranei]
MQHLTDDAFWPRLGELLLGRGQDVGDDLPGAELVVFEGGVEVFRAALARHARHDRDDRAVIWIRPLVAPAGSHGGLLVFDPAVVRRRALHVADARIDEGGLALDLVSGQHARIEPARDARLARLQDFDTWMTTLALEQRIEIEGLEHD